MGEEFTAEELEILGETPPEPEPEASEAPVEEPETEEAPVEEVEEGEETTALDELLEAEQPEEDEEEIPDDGKVPYTRFAKVTGQRNELKQKFDLLRRDPEAYFKLYPDEKPEQEKPPDAPATLDNIDNLTVQGGQYDGLTLAEVREQSPDHAAILEAQYIKTAIPQIVQNQVQQALKATEQQQQQQQYVEESQREIDSFKDSRAQEFFKKPLNNLSTTEAQKLDKLIDQCISWGKTNQRGGGKLEDIYYLMTRDKQLVKAKAAGAGALIDAATKGGKVRSIRSGGDAESVGTGFDRLLDLSPDKAANEIEKMPDKEFAKLMKQGSSELRTKYPGWPWE